MQPGAVIGSYELIEKLGSGAQAVVFRARHRVLGREVALKLFDFGPRDASLARERFLREARTIARLEHPHIVQVYEVGETERGAFLATSLIKGETLASVLARRNALEPQEALALVAKLARAMQFAHERGIVHRDLKPANIIIDETGEPRIIDFGVARELHESRGPTVTEAGTLVGTVAYMSPEQTDGEQSDAASDTWALGVILHECLSGKNPFIAEDVFKTIDRIAAGLDAPPVTPDGESLGLAGEVARDSLRVEKTERLDSARELAARCETARAALAPVPRQSGKRAIASVLFAGATIAVVAVIVSRQTSTNVGDPLAVATTSSAESVATRPTTAATPAPTTPASSLTSPGAQPLPTGSVVVVARIFGAYDPGAIGPIAACRLSKDGARAIAATRTGVQLVTIAPRPVSRTLLTFNRTVRKPIVAISGDGKRGAFASVDEEDVRVWELDSADPPKVLATRARVSSLALTPDGRRLAVGLSAPGDSSRPGGVEIWDTNGKELTGEVGDRGPSVTALAFTEGAARVFLGRSDGSVELRDGETGASVLFRSDNPEAPHPVLEVAVDPAEGCFVAAIGSVTFAAWDENGKRRWGPIAYRGTWGSVAGLGFSPTGQKLVAPTRETVVRVLATADGKPLRSSGKESSGIVAAAFAGSADDSIVVAEAFGRIHAHDPAHALPRWGSPVTALAISPDGRSIAGLNIEGRCKVWSIERGLETSACDLFDGGSAPIAWNREGDRLVAIHGGKAIEVEVATRTHTWTSDSLFPGAQVEARALLEGGGWLLVGLEDRGRHTLVFRELDRYAGLTYELASAAHKIGVVAVSSDGREAFAASALGKAWRCDLASRKAELLERGPPDPVCAAAIEGGVVVFGFGEGSAGAIERGKVQTWVAHKTALRAIALSRDTRWVVTTAEDGKVLVWERREGGPRLLDTIDLAASGDFGASVLFASDDDRTFFVGTSRGVVLQCRIP